MVSYKKKVVWYVEKVIYDANLIKKKIKKDLLGTNSNIISVIFSTLILIFKKIIINDLSS